MGVQFALSDDRRYESLRAGEHHDDQESAVYHQAERGELSQEFGAKAKAGGAMAIPVSPAARKAGAPGNMNVELFIPAGTHVLAEQRKNQLEAFRKGKGAFEVHYVLVKSIPPRLNFRESVTSGLSIVFAEVLNAAKDEVL